jgi:hypothetical protein
MPYAWGLLEGLLHGLATVSPIRAADPIPRSRRNAALIAAGFKLMTRQRDGSEALVHVQLHNSPQESAIARRGALQS